MQPQCSGPAKRWVSFLRDPQPGLRNPGTLTLRVQQEGKCGRLVPGQGSLLQLPFQASLGPGLGENPRELSILISPRPESSPKHSTGHPAGLTHISPRLQVRGISPGQAVPPPSPCPIRSHVALLIPPLPTHYLNSPIKGCMHRSDSAPPKERGVASPLGIPPWQIRVQTAPSAPRPQSSCPSGETRHRDPCFGAQALLGGSGRTRGWPRS